MATPTAIDRRTALVGSLGATGAFAAVDQAAAAPAPLQVHNVTGLYPVEVSRIDVPESTAGRLDAPA